MTIALPYDFKLYIAEVNMECKETYFKKHIMLFDLKCFRNGNEEYDRLWTHPLYLFISTVKEKETDRKKVNPVGKCKEVHKRKRYTTLWHIKENPTF